MALFPQFPYSNLHELNLDWLIEQISQLMENGTVISVNGMSGVVTLYTDKNVVFPDRAFDPDWSVYRRIAEKQAGLQFTGEKFYYITKNVDDEDFTIQEVYTSGNLPPFPVTSVNGQTGDVVIAIPVTSVNGRTGNVILAGDNIPYNIDGTYTIEDVITPLEKAIGHVIRYNTCSDGVTAGQYVYLILSGISGRSDGLYKAVNAKSAGTVWTASDLSPVAGGLGALMASNDSSISELNSNLTKLKTVDEIFSTITDISSGATITLSESINNYLFLVLRLSRLNPATSASRGVLLIPVCDIDLYAFYPVSVGGQNGNVRIRANGTSFRIIEQNVDTQLYVEKVFGICLKA